MKNNILKAINIEEVYLQHKIRGEKVPYQLVDEIQKVGFNSLEEYFDNKREYLFKQLNFEDVKTYTSTYIADAWHELNNNLIRKEASIIFVDTTDAIIYVNTSKSFDEDYCNKNNLNVYKLPTGGGTIVSEKDDLVVAIAVPDNLHTDTHFMLDKIEKILSKYEDNVTIMDNDILINGGKVCGTTFVRNNGMVAYLSHFSFSDNSELIDLICHTDSKPIKPPSYITKLDKDTLKMEVLAWLQST